MTLLYRLLRRFPASVLPAVLTLGVATSEERRLVMVDDLYRVREVDDPQLSPEGEWVAYTVSSADRERDENDTDIFMVPIKGGAEVRLTAGKKDETCPRWSPDGRYLAFLSARDGKKEQVWLLDRRGGEALRLTDFRSEVSELAWSPDGSRLALIVKDPDPAEAGKTEKVDSKKKQPLRPIVITRLQFKRDEEGYLNDLRNHIHIFDLESRQGFQLTQGPYDDTSPTWSPDGRWLVFVSNRSEDPDSNENTDLFLVEARPGAQPVALTSWEGADSSPAFSPDGNWVVYVRGGSPEDVWYDTSNLAAVALEGGTVASSERILTIGLDRNVGKPVVSRDGPHVYFILEERCRRALARVPLTGGEIESVATGEGTVSHFQVGRKGEVVVRKSNPQIPFELFAVSDGKVSQLTRVHDNFLSEVTLATMETIQATSRDGTAIDAFVVKPPGFTPGNRYPAVLWIHGGPVSQFETEFNLGWQILAASGYVVVAANPRGSSGRGRDFSYAIWADWGNRDFEDVMAAVDRVVELGIADPDRLGVGGWSYGGILTNYVITRSRRFKAAVSGASEVNYTANYGHDHYQKEWETELGLPWENLELWVRLSPFFRVQNVSTPTLVMCGQEDWNVPLQNSEQLYQALRRLGVETQLIVYPGEGHSIDRPSFRKDRYLRYLAWYGRFLKGSSPDDEASTEGK